MSKLASNDGAATEGPLFPLHPLRKTTVAAIANMLKILFIFFKNLISNHCPAGLQKSPREGISNFRAKSAWLRLRPARPTV
jgi:hypothetical protein